MNEKHLKTLQMLADIKLKSYKSKWSKKADGHIEYLESNYNDISKLIKYFTRR